MSLICSILHWRETQFEILKTIVNSEVSEEKEEEEGINTFIIDVL